MSSSSDDPSEPVPTSSLSTTVTPSATSSEDFPGSSSSTDGVPSSSPGDWGSSSSAYYSEIHVVNVGYYAGSPQPLFAPNYVKVRQGDDVFFQFISPRQPFSIVQARGVDEPCERDYNGLYIDGASIASANVVNWTDPNAPDPEKVLGWSWIVPFGKTGYVYLYADGYCESGMRATILVTEADSGVGYATAGDSAVQSSPFSSPSHPSPGAIAGIVIGTFAAVGLLGFLLFLFLRKRRRNKNKAETPDWIARPDRDSQVTIVAAPPPEKEKKEKDKDELDFQSDIASILTVPSTVVSTRRGEQNPRAPPSVDFTV